MTRRHAAVPALLLAAGLALTGCSTPPDNDAKKTGPSADPAAAALAVARDYQKATLALDWRRACELSTTRLRGGTVEQCTARHTPDPTPTATPSPTATATFEPPTYADGSTARPRPTKTTAGPERASTGPVTPSGAPVEVPAAGEHPAGWGVMLTYTVTWPTSTSTARKALRVVQEDTEWRVEQREDVQDSDLQHGDPVRDALSRQE
ncbi:hypothetical protein [Streptomyces laurentii]|uniref:hypothetical protein n=1 Tax=Streptomyces laurentii TaxID=39478 RepID=UPI0036737F24